MKSSSRNDRVYRSEIVDATLVREIAYMRIKTRQEKERGVLGEPDVMIKGAVTGYKLITRDELVSSYRDTRGKRIRLLGVHNGKIYTVIRECNIPVKVRMITNGKIKAYEVAIADAEGANKCKRVSSDMFKKMFIMPMQAGVSKEAKQISRIETTVKTVEGIGGNKVKTRVSIMDGNIHKLKVVGRLFNIKGTHMGFVVQDASGKRKQISFATAKELVENKRIQNMEIVTKNGKWFFRGNGVALESLPKYLV